MAWSGAFFHSTPTCTWITAILSNILSNTSLVAISTALLLEQLITQKETIPSWVLYKDGFGYFRGTKQPAGFTAADRGTVCFHPSVAGRVQMAKLGDTGREFSVTVVLWHTIPCADTRCSGRENVFCLNLMVKPAISLVLLGCRDRGRRTRRCTGLTAALGSVLPSCCSPLLRAGGGRTRAPIPPWLSEGSL